MLKRTAVFTLKCLFFSVFFIFFFGLALSGYIIQQSYGFKNKVYPHVYIDGTNYGGKTQSQIIDDFEKKNQKLRQLYFRLAYKEEDVATFSGEMINLYYNIENPLTEAYNVGRDKPFAFSFLEQTATILNLTKFSYHSHLAFNDKPINEYLDDLSDKYNVDPESALFRYENGRVTAFKLERNGIRIEKEKAKKEFADRIKNLNQQKEPVVVSVIDAVSKPAVTLESINDFGIAEKIAEGQSDYTGSIPGRVHNVILAASKFDGVLIPKGEILSFNKIIGDISATTGYQQAYIIKEGRTILGDGGGVCQVSTTLFRAALDAGLPIVERHAHAYRVHYYENDKKPGFDATVFSPRVDLRIENDTPAHILIQTSVDKSTNLLTFAFYGKKDNRVVSLSDAKVWDVRPAPEPVYEDDPTLKKGVIKQIDWAAPGAKASFHYRVEKNGGTTTDRDFFSNFRPWRAVYAVGIAD